MKSTLPLMRMLQIADSIFPIGAFTLSDGMETFVAEKRLKTAEDLNEYVDSYLKIFSYNDLAGMIMAYKICEKYSTNDIPKNIDKYDREMSALEKNKADALIKLDNLMFALKSPSEVREGNMKMCSRFIKLWENLTEYRNLENYGKLISENRAYGVHAVAVGLFAYDIGLDIETAAGIYTYQKLSSVVTNAVKIVPLSQIKGQAVLNGALRKIPNAVKTAQLMTFEDFGMGGSMFDIECMRHEKMYSRLYMS